MFLQPLMPDIFQKPKGTIIQLLSIVQYIRFFETHVESLSSLSQCCGVLGTYNGIIGKAIFMDKAPK